MYLDPHISPNHSYPGERVMIFIDGQNLYHALRSIGLRESQVDWNWLFHQLAGEGTLIEVQWHRPRELQGIQLKEQKVLEQLLQRQYPKQVDQYVKLYQQRALPNHVFEELKRAMELKRKWYAWQRKRFSDIAHYYWNLAIKYNKIKLVRSGVVKIDPYTQDWLGEKGVDVSVATEITHAASLNLCDRIILISGDLDFQWTVKKAQELGKTVELVQFSHYEKKSNISRELAGMANKKRMIRFGHPPQNRKKKRRDKKHYYHVMRKKAENRIAESNLQEAIVEMLHYCKRINDNKANNDILNFKRRLVDMNRLNMRQLITAKDLNVQRSTLCKNILDYLDFLAPLPKK